MDTSEAEQGEVSSDVGPGVVTSGDTIYQGINFTGLRRELSVQKLWRERTWREILRNFVTALIFGALGSFIDISTDGLTAKSFISGANYTKWVKNLSDPANHDDCVHTGRFTSFNPAPHIEFEQILCFEQDPMWGHVTIYFLLLPGCFFASEVSRIICDHRGKTSDLYQILLAVCLTVPCEIIFPLVLILVKVVCLIKPGPEWKRVNARISGLEGSWESAFQTILALFIIFTRADRQPSSFQIASLVASFLMITKTSIAEHLSPKQPLELKEKLKATATLLPLFLSNATFKVLSWAITFTCLRYIAYCILHIAVLVLVTLGILGLYALQKKARFCPKKTKNTLQGHSYTSLRLEVDSKLTKRQNMEICVSKEIIWGIYHLIILTSLVGAANINPDSLNFSVTDFWNAFRNLKMKFDKNFKSSRHIPTQRPSLVDNLPLLNGLYIGVLAAMALSAVLFYFQMWKPMVEEEEAEQRESKAPRTTTPRTTSRTTTRTTPRTTTPAPTGRTTPPLTSIEI